MSWWNRIKKIWLPILVSILFLIGISLFVLGFAGPKTGNTFCTMVGCLGGIGVVLEGLPDSTLYELEIQNLHGRKQTLTCEIGKDEDQIFGNSCVPTGAMFRLNEDEVPPKEITVTVTINGKKFSNVFHPSYEKNQPNGEPCPPVCYSSTIVMLVSP
jgi:hypothetical protein